MTEPVAPLVRPWSDRPVRVVEVLGPAGAGKTTLIRALLASVPEVRTGVPLSAAARVRTLGRILGGLLPPYLREYRDTRWFTREELRRMVYLEAWHRELVRQPASTRQVTLFDHGPLFMLGMLRAFGPEVVGSRYFADWSEAILTRWGGTLGIVLWLDAPDSMLVERIETRQCHHAVKGKSIGEARAFLQRSRAAFEAILATLKPPVAPQVLHFDTSRIPTDCIVERIVPLLKGQDPVGVARPSMGADSVA